MTPFSKSLPPFIPKIPIPIYSCAHQHYSRQNGLKIDSRRQKCHFYSGSVTFKEDAFDRPPISQDSLTKNTPTRSEIHRVVCSFLERKIHETPKEEHSNTISLENLKNLRHELLRDFQSLHTDSKLIYTVLTSELYRIHRSRDISQEQKDFVMHYVESLAGRTEKSLNPSEICDELMPKLSIKRRRLLFRLVHAYVQQVCRKTISPHIRQVVRSHIEQSTYPEKTSLICDELQPILKLPRGTLYDVVKQQSLLLKRQQVTPEMMHTIQRHIAHSEHRDNLSIMAGQVSHDVPIERNLLLHLLQQELVKWNRNLIEPRHRASVQEYLRSIPPRNLNDIPLLCDTLEAHLNLPKSILPILIREEIAKMAKLTPTERESVRECVLHSENLDDISKLFEEVRRENLVRETLPLEVLKRAVQKERRWILHLEKRKKQELIL